MRMLTLRPIVVAWVTLSVASTGPALALSTLSSPSSTLDVAPPGAYTGPSDEEIPDGWYGWSGRTRDAREFKQCGSLKLVFKNTDLQEDDDGIVHAQNQFFIQFQAVGQDADKVTRFAFSFGVTTPDVNDNPQLNCNTAIPPNPFGSGTAGAYLLYYRSDYDPKDGFFVPILTKNVPDGGYAAAVHAYTGDCGSGAFLGCTEVARGWTRAIVKNCPDLSGPNTCVSATPEQIVAQDHTLPWPMILPGDGEQTNKIEGQTFKGLTIEFPEEMINTTVKASLNGESLKLLPWVPPQRDSDLQPNNDFQDCPKVNLVVTTVNGIRSVCERTQYGPGWRWPGDVEIGDVIRVEGKDKNKNHLIRIVHYGLDTSGGAVNILKPDVEMAAINGDKVEIKPGDFHEFNIRLTNLGGNDAHVNLLLNYTEGKGLTADWTTLEGSATSHVVVPAASNVVQKVKVQADKSLDHAEFKLSALADYDAEGFLERRTLYLRVNVDPEAGTAHTHSHGAGITDTAAPTTDGKAAAVPKDEGGGIPSLGPLTVLVLLGALVVAVRPRRK